MFQTIRHPRRVMVIAALAATLLTTATACTSTSTGTATGASSSNHQLVVAVNSAPPTFDPSSVDEGSSAVIWTGIFDTLLTLDKSGQIVPNAASAFSYSPDKRTLTLSIRSGMKFSNGDAVNAEAVAGTLNRTKTNPGPTQGKLQNVTSIKATDKSKVVIELAVPDPKLLSELTNSLGVIADPATFSSKDIALDPVGSGPYLLDKSATVAGSTYVLERRSGYWNPRAFPFEKVTVRVIQDPTATFNALQSGELNAGIVQPNQVDAMKSAGFTISYNPLIAVAGLVFLDRQGTVQPQLADLRVRQAISMAFDRAKYAKVLGAGAAEANDQLVGKGTPAYVKDLANKYPFDPAKAKKLLADAGYPNGFTVKMPSNFLSKSYEPSIGQSLADIGIKVDWVTVPAQEVISSLYTKQYPMMFWMQGSGYVQQDFSSVYGQGGYLNVFQPSDPKLDALFNKAGTASQAEVPAAYQAINRYLVDNAYSAPIFSFGAYRATKDGVKFVGLGALNPLMNTLRAWSVQ